jgi:hypothetical protein
MDLGQRCYTMMGFGISGVEPSVPTATEWLLTFLGLIVPVYQHRNTSFSAAHSVLR